MPCVMHYLHRAPILIVPQAKLAEQHLHRATDPGMLCASPTMMVGDALSAHDALHGPQRSGNTAAADHASSTAAVDGLEPCISRITLTDQTTVGQTNTPAPSPSHASTHDECAECVICWDARANVILQPCGHLLACSGCIGLLTGLPCPMCRSGVLSCVVVQE